jgi:hypothetical protein
MGEPRDVNEKPLCKISQKWKSLVRAVYFLQQKQNREKKKKEGRKNTEP